VQTGEPDRFVYLMPESVWQVETRGGVGLAGAWREIWAAKWKIIAVTLLFSAASLIYALLAEEWFRAEVLLAPPNDRAAAPLGQLSGLASLAGVRIGGGDAVEAVATLKSREFAREFIEDHSLVTVLLADEWDHELERWRGEDPAAWPDVRDAIKYFHEEVLGVRRDPETGLVTMAVEWKDPAQAADWANALVRRVNAKLRERALREAEANVSYLQAELSGNSIITLQQSIGRLLEHEHQKVMLARGNEEFAFRIIDGAETPRKRIRPKRALIVIGSTLVGALLSILAVLIVRPRNADR
jgi:LPS O-antigen subunit length determinant protein (WzzB/FepE family)